VESLVGEISQFHRRDERGSVDQWDKTDAKPRFCGRGGGCTTL
jgi:hypothetical protein